MNFEKVALTSEIPDGSMKTFVIKDKKITVGNIGNEFFAVDDTCTHEQCSLAGEGFLDGKNIICGCHGSQFEASSGKVLTLPATADLKTYKTKIENNILFVEI